MSTSPMPNIECEQHHTGIVVSDLETAIDFYTNKLGFWLAFKWGEPTTMAGVNLGHVQIFLEHGEPSPKGCYLYFVINDADAFHEFHRNNGVEIVQPLGDRDYGIRDYSVRDLHGYVLSFGHRLPANCDEEDHSAEISGISPFFIVSNVPSSLSFYRDRLGFTIALQGPTPDDIFFGIVRRGRAQILLKDVGVIPTPNYTRDVKQGIARWDAFVVVPDPDALAAEFASRNVEFSEPLKDTDDGLRGFEVKDADGYVLFFGRPR